MSVSKQYRKDRLLGTVALESASVAIVSSMYQSTEAIQALFLRDKPHPNKTMLTFQDFYPFYLKEHSDSTNRMLHFIGTSTIILLCLLYSPRTLAALGFVLPLALTVFFSTVSMERGFLEMGAVFALFLTIHRLIVGNFRGALGVMLLGYGFAWFGHFFFEHNKPATFTYPTFSLMGDFYMWFQLATGAIKF